MLVLLVLLTLIVLVGGGHDRDVLTEVSNCLASTTTTTTAADTATINCKWVSRVSCLSLFGWGYEDENE